MNHSEKSTCHGIASWHYRLWVTWNGMPIMHITQLTLKMKKSIHQSYLSSLSKSILIHLIPKSSWNMFISILPLQNLHLRAFIACSSTAQPWHLWPGFPGLVSISSCIQETVGTNPNIKLQKCWYQPVRHGAHMFFFSKFESDNIHKPTYSESNSESDPKGKNSILTAMTTRQEVWLWVHCCYFDKAFYENEEWQWIKEEMPFITLKMSILETKAGTCLISARGCSACAV